MSQTESVVQRFVTERQAARYQRRADLWTKLRDKGAIPIGVATALLPEGWILGTATAGLHGTDLPDGIDARRAAAILGQPTTPEGGERDHKADKKLFYGLAGGLIVRSTLRRQWKNVALYGGITTIVAARDTINRNERATALEEGIDVKARPIGKIKTWLFGAATSVLNSPLVSEPGGEQAGQALLVAGTALAVYGQYDMHRHIKAVRQEQSTNVTAELPPLTSDES